MPKVKKSPEVKKMDSKFCSYCNGRGFDANSSKEDKCMFCQGTGLKEVKK